MKKLIILIILFLSLFGYAQKTNYHRVKIQTDNNGLVKLAKAGVAVDHGFYKKNNYFIGEFSDNELNLIKKSGLSHEVLISNLSSYYANRNKSSNKTTSNAASCKDCYNYPIPANFTNGSMGGFYTYQEYLDIMDSMTAKFPNLISTRQAIDTSHTWEGRSVYWLRISNNPNVNQNKPQVLYTAIHHAREPESLVELVYFMWYLLENYNSNAEVKYLVDNLELYFVPCVNPDGYIYNETTNPNGGGMWRKNRRNNGDGTYGVDLNRNYNFLWGLDDIGSSPNTVDETYRGPSPASEPETQMMQSFCNTHNFSLSINGHTYGDLLIAPDSAGITVPDSTLYNNYLFRMTFCDEFGYGNSMQTVGYSVNGDSDSWMYGEKTTKPQILAMTPETGSNDDGFYPVSTNITPLAQKVMDQNMYAARLTASYAKVDEQSGPFIQQSGYIKYSIQRLGLQAGTYTVSIIPVSSTFQSVGASKVYAGMSKLQTLTDSINYNLISGLNNGNTLQFLLQVNNGGYISTDTITKVYGTPIYAFNDNCNSTAQWTGNWGVSTTQFVSATGSITDSPNGLYNNNTNTKTTTTAYINLTDALAAFLQFDARWQVERGYDYVELQASTNGTTFTPLCGKYTHTGNSSQDNLQPLYDGIQDAWVHDVINLSAYLGQSIKLRFNLVSDSWTNYDGLYFDNLNVQKITAGSSGIQQQTTVGSTQLLVYPNPAKGDLFIGSHDLQNTSWKLLITDITGRTVLENNYPENNNIVMLNPQLSNGVYFVKAIMPNGNIMQQKLVIAK